VTVGFGTAEAANHLAAGMFRTVHSPRGDVPVGVRVRAESDLTAQELALAVADIERQAG
jgi:hypothetical protein